ncbi:MAG: PT domain-containing protein [Ilumatobacter sp.]|nr:PT domain-containing protein [Ilumatobacter sp.]
MNKRVIIGVAASFVLAACGSGGDDDAASASEPTQEESTDESTDEPIEESTDEPVDEPSEEPADEPVDEPEDEPTDDGDDETIEIDSLSDAPPECMDLFITYLRDIEPFVENVDWETATFAELEQIGTDFDTLSTDFDEEGRRIGCNQFTFDDDDAAFDEMIEVARREAPGTVGFFEFISGFRDAAIGGGDGGDGGDGGGSSAGTPETCDEAIAGLDSLVDQYDTINDVPAGELSNAIGIVSSLTIVCSINELEQIYEREDISVFLDG